MSPDVSDTPDVLDRLRQMTLAEVEQRLADLDAARAALSLLRRSLAARDRAPPSQRPRRPARRRSGGGCGVTPATAPTDTPPAARGLTVRDVARRYRVSPDKVRAWITSGELRAVNTATALCGRPRWVVPAD